MLYAPILQLMKAQSLLHLGRYMASAIDGACCFESILDGSVIKTDRFDPLKITEAARFKISLVDRVRGRVRIVTRDIVFAHDKPIARASKQASVAVKAEDQDTVEGDGEVDDDEAMGADYEAPGKEDVQDVQHLVADDDDMMVEKDEDE